MSCFDLIPVINRILWSLRLSSVLCLFFTSFSKQHDRVRDVSRVERYTAERVDKQIFLILSSCFTRRPEVHPDADRAGVGRLFLSLLIIISIIPFQQNGNEVTRTEREREREAYTAAPSLDSVDSLEEMCTVMEGCDQSKSSLENKTRGCL